MKNSLYLNIRKKAEQNRRTGATPKKPTAEMLKQERKIKAKQYPDGGKVKPIYTNNRNDPRLLDYNDSLKTYLAGQENLKKLLNAGFEIDGESMDQAAWDKYLTDNRKDYRGDLSYTEGNYHYNNPVQYLVPDKSTVAGYDVRYLKLAGAPSDINYKERNIRDYFNYPIKRIPLSIKADYSYITGEYNKSRNTKTINGKLNYDSGWKVDKDTRKKVTEDRSTKVLLPMYKKPVQPVIYQDRPKLPELEYLQPKTSSSSNNEEPSLTIKEQYVNPSMPYPGEVRKIQPYGFSDYGSYEEYNEGDGTGWHRVKANGGTIIDPRGQWAHPGKRTIVPSPTGQITMQGVPYPVYGEDETGYGQIMYPNNEYQFPGKMIDETPIKMQGGGPTPARPTMYDFGKRAWPLGFRRGFFDIPGVGIDNGKLDPTKRWALDNWDKLSLNEKNDFIKYSQKDFGTKFENAVSALAPLLITGATAYLSQKGYEKARENPHIIENIKKFPKRIYNRFSDWIHGSKDITFDNGGFIYQNQPIDNEKQKLINWYNHPETKYRLVNQFKKATHDLPVKDLLFNKGPEDLNERRIQRTEESLENALSGLEETITNAPIMLNPTQDEFNEYKYSQPLKYQKEIDKTLKKHPQAFTGPDGKIVILNPNEQILNYKTDSLQNQNKPDMSKYLEYDDSEKKVHELIHRASIKTSIGDTHLDELMKDKFPAPKNNSVINEWTKNKRELYPFLMQLRLKNDFKPGEIITPERLQEIKKSGYNNHLFRYYDDAELSKILNTLASNKQQSPYKQYAAQGGYLYQGGGKLPKYTYANQEGIAGGPFKTPTGQWQLPVSKEGLPLVNLPEVNIEAFEGIDQDTDKLLKHWANYNSLYGEDFNDPVINNRYQRLRSLYKASGNPKLDVTFPAPEFMAKRSYNYLYSGDDSNPKKDSIINAYTNKYKNDKNYMDHSVDIKNPAKFYHMILPNMYSPLFNEINYMSTQDSPEKGDTSHLIEELAHAYQNNKLGKNVLNSWVKEMLDNPSFSKSAYFQKYQKPKSFEYEAHSVIAPKMYEYLDGKISLEQLHKYFINQKAKGGYLYSKGGETDPVKLSERSWYNTNTGEIKTALTSPDNKTWQEVEFDINGNPTVGMIKHQLPEIEISADSPDYDFQGFRKKIEGDALESVYPEAALLPASLPFQATSRLGKVALSAAEMLNPVSGFKGSSIKNIGDYKKGLKKIMPEKEYLTGKYSQHAGKELKKAALAFSPSTTKAIGRLDDNIAKSMLSDYRYGEYSSVKDFRKAVKKAILESERLKKIHPTVDFGKLDETNNWGLKKPETLKQYADIQLMVDKSKASQKSFMNYLEKEYNKKMDLINQNEVFKNIANESPQYTDIIYDHLKNPKVSDDEFVNNLVKQSNTFTRAISKPPTTVEEFLTLKGRSLGEGKKNTTDVEGFPVSGDYGFFRYKIEPNAERMAEIAATPIEQRWAQRFPENFTGKNENIDFKQGWHTKQSEAYNNWWLKRLNRNRTVNNVPMIKYPAEMSIPYKYINYPQHSIFNSELEDQFIKGFDVSKINIENPYKYIPGFTRGFAQGGKINPYMYYAGGPYNSSGYDSSGYNPITKTYETSKMPSVSEGQFFPSKQTTSNKSTSMDPMTIMALAQTADQINKATNNVMKKQASKFLDLDEEEQKIAFSADETVGNIPIVGTALSNVGNMWNAVTGKTKTRLKDLENKRIGEGQSEEYMNRYTNNFITPTSPNLNFAATGGDINNLVTLQNPYSMTNRYKDYKTKYRQGGSMNQSNVDFISDEAGLHQENVYNGVPLTRGEGAYANGGAALVEAGEGVIRDEQGNPSFILPDQGNGEPVYMLQPNASYTDFERDKDGNYIQLPITVADWRKKEEKRGSNFRDPENDYISNPRKDNANQLAMAATEIQKQLKAQRDMNNEMMVNGALQYAAAGGKLNKDLEKILSNDIQRYVEADNYYAYGGYLPRDKGFNMPNSYAKGGSIHIKESKKGTFTAAAKKRGKSVQEFAKQVLANKGNYSAAMVKKANFARNAAKWKHAEGGPTDPPDQWSLPIASRSNINQGSRSIITAGAGNNLPFTEEGVRIINEYDNGLPNDTSYSYMTPTENFFYNTGQNQPDGKPVMNYQGSNPNPNINDYLPKIKGLSRYAAGGPMVSNVQQPFEVAAQNRGGMLMDYANGGYVYQPMVQPMLAEGGNMYYQDGGYTGQLGKEHWTTTAAGLGQVIPDIAAGTMAISDLIKGRYKVQPEKISSQKFNVEPIAIGMKGETAENRALYKDYINRSGAPIGVGAAMLRANLLKTGKDLVKGLSDLYTAKEQFDISNQRSADVFNAESRFKAGQESRLAEDKLKQNLLAASQGVFGKTAGYLQKRQDAGWDQWRIQNMGEDYMWKNTTEGLKQVHYDGRSGKYYDRHTGKEVKVIK